MRHAARITLFVQDRDGKLDTFPDLEVLHALLRQVPLVTRNPGGGRTLVFDITEPATALAHAGLPPQPNTERLRAMIAAVGTEARALGLPLTAALAESAEIVAETEMGEEPQPGGRG